jgi:hypothetical protein
LLFGELALSRHLSSLSREDSRFNWANFWGAGQSDEPVHNHRASFATEC